MGLSKIMSRSSDEIPEDIQPDVAEVPLGGCWGSDSWKGHWFSTNLERQDNTEIIRQELGMTFCQTSSWCIINQFRRHSKECLRLVSNRDNAVLYRS